MDPQQGQPALQIGDYLAILRVRRWLVLAIAVVFTVGGIVYALTLKASYVSTSEVLLAASNDPTGTIVTEISPDTEAQIATSADVAIIAKPSMSTDLTPTELISQLTVSLPPDSLVLDFRFTADTPASAQDGANGFANAYLEFKKNQIDAAITAQTDLLQSTIDTLKVDYKAALRANDAAQAQFLLASITANEQTKSQLGIVIPNPGRVIGAATTAKSAGTSPIVIVLAAAFLGLIVGSVTAFVAEGMSGAIRSAEDVEHELNAPILGVLPFVPGVHLRREMLVTEVAPTSMAGEAYRMLRSGLLYAVKDDMSVLLVTSSGVGEGKTTVAANLAVSLAQADKRVILVGGDLRRPEVHAYFGVPNDRGLVQVLDGGEEPALVMTGVPNLRLLPSGPPLEMSAQLFEGAAYPELLDRLRDAADIIIIDAPPLAISDPLVMAAYVDGILLVSDMKQADRSALRRVRELLERAGLKPMGTILNKFEGEWSRKYGAYGAYYTPYRDHTASAGRPRRGGTESTGSPARPPRDDAGPLRDQGRRA